MSSRTLAILIGGLLLSSAARGAQNEAVAYGVDNFESSGECDDGGAEDTHYSEGTADKVDDVFDDWIADGKWGQSTQWFNKALDDVDLTDSAEETWGNDTDDNHGIDHADVGFFMTHGDSETSGTATSSFLMGDSSGNTCVVDTNDHMRFGNGGDNDLEVVIASACQSAQKEVWDAHGYDLMRTSTGSMNTWLGFHGDLISGPFFSGTVKNYVQDTYTEGLGETWVDKLYSWNVTYEVCPVAIIWATSEANCDSVYEHGGMADRDNDGSGTKSTTGYYYIEGCDPQNGSELPS